MHKEIVDFCDFLSPTSEEREVRTTAGEAVLDLFKYTWPKCKPKVFGTFRTGLYLPTSDIDVIAKARVPIVKFFEKKSGVSFDISCASPDCSSASPNNLDALAECPPLRPLCLILKVFLQQRELNEVYSGGIGSFALLTMIMAVLKIVNDVPYMAYLQSLYKCRASPEHNLGILLVNFFDFYGRKLKTTDVGVSCKGAGSFFKKSSKGFTNKGRPFLIAIEDPQAPDNAIGKNSFNYFQIKSAFAMAFTTLTNPKTILSLGQTEAFLSDYEEESFARGNGSVQSCGKRRKAFSKEKSTSKKKTEEIGESKSHEEGGSKKEKSGGMEMKNATWSRHSSGNHVVGMSEYI
ncbi:nucleotidyltransferase family protein [Citrus sinensis]|uniref:Nucleotidyltransferase family protein n=1 Tax=Citrus sinensis TaxID=2711 RepID=A0ACB8NYX5_CITSI|nr:nucleotidyltransferase family protein [Citrus sinensis]